MPIVLNTNATATTASNNLSRASDALRKSLSRLSSGYRIVSPEDDAGGLAVAYKLSAQLRRNHAIKHNVQNGISFLQVQDAALTSAGTVVSRMAELRAMAQDVTKNTSDIENYSKEFLELQQHLNQLYREKFNGVSLFAMSSSQAKLDAGQPILNKGTFYDLEGNEITKFSRRIFTHDSGLAENGSVSINVVNFQEVFKLGALDANHAHNFSGKLANLSNAGKINASNYSTVGANRGNALPAEAVTTETESNEESTDTSIVIPNGAAFLPLGDASNVSFSADGKISGYEGPKLFSNAEDVNDGISWRLAIRENFNEDSDVPTLSFDQQGDVKLYTFDLPVSMFTYNYKIEDLVTYGEGNFSLDGNTDGTTLGTFFASGNDNGNLNYDDDFQASSGSPVYSREATLADIGLDSGGYSFHLPYVDDSSSEETSTTDEVTESTDETSGESESQVIPEIENTTPDENAEVFTDEGFLSSIMYVSMEQFTEVINRIADARAENGAEQSRLLKVDELLSSKISNLEAAHGRIMDVDVALESSRLARTNVLVQSSAAMVAQANQLTGIALTILNG